mmetsp:Transcript_118721/g.242721  ORF Transcript_118721/g.242721 Transcript_118721/m.242721 type:complete len:218 (-) Transcript_118721:1987-2640(-)
MGRIIVHRINRVEGSQHARTSNGEGSGLCAVVLALTVRFVGCDVVQSVQRQQTSIGQFVQDALVFGPCRFQCGLRSRRRNRTQGFRRLVADHDTVVFFFQQLLEGRARLIGFHLPQNVREFVAKQAAVFFHKDLLAQDLHDVFHRSGSIGSSRGVGVTLFFFVVVVAVFLLEIDKKLFCVIRSSHSHADGRRRISQRLLDFLPSGNRPHDYRLFRLP